MFNRLSAVLDQTAARLPARSAAYFWLFSGWAMMLWVLSSGNPSLKQANEIPHMDKVLHFIYFSVGGALLAASSGLKWRSSIARVAFFTGCPRLLTDWQARRVSPRICSWENRQ